MDKSFAETYLDFSQINMETMKQAFIDTLYMTLVSMVLVTIIGLVLGLILYSIGRKNKPYARIIYGIVSIISNIFRSTPFMILMVLIIPFTKAIVGTMLGAQAAIPALVLSAAPFYARLVEIAFREVSPGVLEAGGCDGCQLLGNHLESLDTRKRACTDLRIDSYYHFDDRLYCDGGCDRSWWFGRSCLARRLPTW